MDARRPDDPHLAATIGRLAAAEGPRILSALLRDVRDLELAEEAVQEAWAAALRQWPSRGVPDRPLAWVLTVARRRAIDAIRRHRPTDTDRGVEDLAAPEAPSPAPEGVPDERLRLLFTCCHPSLAPKSQVALALRTLCGLTTEEVARAFLEPVTATAQRISRAAGKIRDARIPYEVPEPSQLPERLGSVLSAIYLVFNEGYASTTHPDYLRADLCAEAIRLADLVARLLPEPEVLGLAALMKLHDARRTARMDAHGVLVPLDAQDRSRWDRDRIDIGLADLDRALASRRAGPYQIQAAIAALHARAERAEDTDWAQISALYGALLQRVPTPVVELNAAMALAMAAGPEEGLIWLDSLVARGELAEFHLLAAARADLLARLGRVEEASRALTQAVARAPHPAERAHLEEKLRALGSVRAPVGRRRRTRRIHGAPRDRVPRLSDAAWLSVAAWFPDRPPGSRGRPATPARTVLDAILWVLSTGSPWRELPDRFGRWQTAYDRFRQWERDGRFARVMAELTPRP